MKPINEDIIEFVYNEWNMGKIRTVKDAIKKAVILREKGE